MRLKALALFAALAVPAFAQELPDITAEQIAAASAAVEAANLSETTYRDLWCGGAFALKYALAVQAAQPGAAEFSAARDKLYRKAAVDLLAAGVTEGDFTELAENVFRVALGQTRSDDAATRDFTDEECETAVATN